MFQHENDATHLHSSLNTSLSADVHAPSLLPRAGILTPPYSLQYAWSTMWLERYWHLSDPAVYLDQSVFVEKGMKFIRTARQIISKFRFKCTENKFKINNFPSHFCVLTLLVSFDQIRIPILIIL